MINSSVMNIGVHVSLSDLVSSVCMPRSGIAGSYGSSISSFLRHVFNQPTKAEYFVGIRENFLKESTVELSLSYMNVIYVAIKKEWFGICGDRDTVLIM